MTAALRFPYPKTWRYFCLLVGILFVVRGLLLLCFLPPLEGWDEYQHIAYLEYLNRNKSTPVYGKAFVPESLYDDLVANPHCRCDWAQTRSIGALPYEAFYDNEPEVKEGAVLRLYQAQHPPLYYQIFAPLYRAASDSLGFRQSVYILRIINILLAGAALALFLSPLNRLYRSGRFARLAALTIGSLPIYLVYVARVCNDGLALLISAAVFAIVARISDDRALVLKSIVIGLLIGVGVLTKLLVIVYLPVCFCFTFFLWIRKKVSAGRAALALGLLLTAYLLVTFSYHRDSYRTLGTPFPAQETVANKEAGKGFVDLAAEVRLDHLERFLLPVVKMNLWASGWSFLRSEKIFINLYFWLVVFCWAGAVPLALGVLLRKKPGAGNVSPRIWVLCLATFFFSFLALYAHALSSQVAYGQLQVVCHYAAVGFPAFFACAFAALQGYRSSRLAFTATALFLAVLIAAECRSLLFVALPHWANSSDFSVALDRLASVHPAFPAPWCLLPLLFLFLLLFAIALRALFHDGSPDDAERTADTQKTVDTQKKVPSPCPR